MRILKRDTSVKQTAAPSLPPRPSRSKRRERFKRYRREELPGTRPLTGACEETAFTSRPLMDRRAERRKKNKAARKARARNR